MFFYYKDLIQVQKNIHPCIRHAISKYVHAKQLMHDYVMYQCLVYTYPLSNIDKITYEKLHKKMHKIVQVTFTAIPMNHVNQMCSRDESAYYCNFAIAYKMPNIHVYKLHDVSEDHYSQISAL
jgi:hypothetical protein